MAAIALHAAFLGQPLRQRPARAAARRPPAAAARASGGEFERSAAQQKIKDADAAVDSVRKAAGGALGDAFSPLGGILGVGKQTKAATPSGMPQKLPWSKVQPFLKEQGLKSVSPREAKAMMGKGKGLFGRGRKTVLVDVRPLPDFEVQHAVGAESVPICQDIDGFSLRKALFMAQAVRPIEDNPDFVEELQALGDIDIIFACAPGGTLTETTNFPVGQQSRSLLACYRALALGLTDGAVMHLQGGLNGWFSAGMPGEGEGDWEDVSGRTPSVPGFTPEQDAQELM